METVASSRQPIIVNASGVVATESVYRGWKDRRMIEGNLQVAAGRGRTIPSIDPNPRYRGRKDTSKSVGMPIKDILPGGGRPIVSKFLSA